MRDEQLAREFARTYTEINERDGWDRVQEYRRVAEYMAEHPRKGSSAVASALELPRSRIRSWVDGDARPDPVRGLEIAADKGWLTRDWDDPTARALNVLVAWIFSGGSIIADSYAATFIADTDRAEDVVTAVLATAGVEAAHHEPSAAEGATEIVPAEHRTVLGRVLAVWGAPVGTKNDATELTLPEYLDTAPESVGREFARTYVANRGHLRTDKSDQLQVTEERTPVYRADLHELFERAFPDASQITRSDLNIYIYADNTTQLATHPDWNWLSTD